MWRRIDRVRKPLEAPYEGPFRVISRNDKNLTIELPNGSHSVITIDRAKPVILCNSPQLSTHRQRDVPLPVEEIVDPPVEEIVEPPVEEIVEDPVVDVPDIIVPDSVENSHVAPDVPVVVDDIPTPVTVTTRSRRRVKFNKNPDFVYY